MSPDLFNVSLAALLTLMVYSYLLRDNPLYRLAEHLLVATSLAYVLVVVIHHVLVPNLLTPIEEGTATPDLLLIPFVLGVLLVAKALPRGSQLGNIGLAYLVGMGLALATGGALVGTLIPQSLATMLPLLPRDGLTWMGVASNVVLIVGTLAVLFSFFFFVGRSSTIIRDEETETPQRPPVWRVVGRWFLMITFGAIFGGITLSYMSLLVGRLDFLIDVVNRWLGAG